MESIVDIATRIGVGVWDVSLAAAPWLLLGLVFAGVIRAWLPDRLVARWLGGQGVGAVIRAAIIGTPLPLCSCGVVPAAIGLRRQGASKPSTVSFLVSTPENGADSIALTYALMGPVMAIARPVAALLASIVAGVLTLLLSDPDEPRGPTESDEEPCEHHAAMPGASCCHTNDAEPTRGPVARLIEGVRYAFTTLLDDLAIWLAVGVGLAGVLAGLVPPDALAEWGSGPLAMLAMAVVGVPIYVCATSFTPVGASLLVAGVSPGAVLVLLLAGPATNIGTIGIVKRELGGRALAAYLFGVIAMSIGAGVALDAIVSSTGLSVADQAGHEHAVFPAWVSIAAAAVIIVLAIRPLRRAVFGAIASGRGAT